MTNYSLRILWQGMGHVLAPRVCAVCGQSLSGAEQTICLECNLDLPRSNVHHNHFNVIHQRLGHHCPVSQAAGWFYYRKGSPFAQMLVEAKYSNRPALALSLGEMCAEELAADHFFDNIDVLVPMPMHWLKRWRRGYNQAEEIAIGMSRATGLPVANALKAVRSHSIQSRQSKQQRYLNITNSMTVSNPQSIQNRNILIVDDIITTGASMSEAVSASLKAFPQSISVIALGLTALT